MSVRGDPIRFTARLLRPAQPKGAAWTFLVLPDGASGLLPSRSQVTVDATLDGHAFQATLEPDGRGGHWLKVGKALREAAGAEVGATVSLTMAPVAKEPEPRLPPDLRKALGADAEAQARWTGLTTVARRDWIQWIVSAKKPETRERRIAGTPDMLRSGKRRVCCFDRSGIYGKNLSAPEAAP
ncbi:YdeI/OmpD-associated family protein [Luteimonas abyssi]|uniref:YdeI/OmpD-associated family protein n=1 Tax=Luteimonas abyssi TaxID=1247514 RepID=UPI000737D021|nr:YdeI/OmpD-associated family protein [Luteimonas abyssi]